MLFLGWGSFLNMFAYRIIHGGFERLRSFCLRCTTTIAWYDNIPLISWIALRGRCRHCSKPISLLYPTIELFTACILTLLWILIPAHYFPAYFLFFSALIVTIRTDCETMLISRFVSLYLIPLGWLLSSLGYLPITIIESILGSIIGYAFLWITAQLFLYITSKEGLGHGDIELISFIGAYTGIIGCWMSIMLGSIIGSVCGIYIILTHPKTWRTIRIPFGPFLAVGAMLFILAYDHIIVWLETSYF
ncbi:MAG: prepilin peptidase [Candidatus Babeliales bacterium]